ncbi:WD40 repeat domain-containing serine/threonine protein kinase [Kitasatospora sp. NPDC059327]|uniref:WD40 repeat domain-containing serine/threonine protein kinase n=1 Tax=Kitasatospora sp. NPDC059327 TaxID=3346803 RepID=UPI00368948F6
MGDRAVEEVLDDRYEVKEVAGEGGMGRVLRVLHRQWGIDLAVKTPKPEVFATDEQRERFVTEAEAWVALGLHPNICGCHYVRVVDGVPYVFSEYVGDGSLHDWIADRRLYGGGPDAAVARIVDLAVQMAWGVGHAHAAGLVHRDVKPANVLLDVQGGDIVAKVTDFGLARIRPIVAEDDGGLAHGVSAPVSAGGRTPAYASPEQLSNRPVGRRTDTFSLGVTVLEMFTGGPRWGRGPFANDTIRERHGIESYGPGLPPLPPDLADLLERCLAPDPEKRPGSMAAVAEELAAIHLRVTGERYRRLEPKAADLRADELNNRALSLLDLDRDEEAAAAFTAALTADPQHTEATLNSGLWRWRGGEITDEELVADLDAVRTDTDDSWPARHALGLVHLERGDLAEARPLLDRVDRERPGLRDVGEALQTLGAGTVPDADCVGINEIRWSPTAAGEPDPMLHIDVSADGRTAVTGGDDEHVRVWDVRTGRCLRTLRGHRAKLRSVRITPDGRYCASVEYDSVMRIWDLSDGRCLRTIRAANSLDWAAVSSREGIAVATERVRKDGVHGVDVVVWDLRQRQVRRRLHGPLAQFPEAELSPDGRWVLVAGYEDCIARLWDLRTGECAQVLDGKGVNQPVLCFDMGHGRAAIADSHDAIGIWDLRTARRVRTLRCSVKSLALSADAAKLLVGARDGAVRLWDLETGKCVRTFRGHQGAAGHVRWGRGDRFALSASLDNTLRLWRMPDSPAVPFQVSLPRRHGVLNLLEEKVRELLETAAAREAAGDRAAALHALRDARAVPGHERAPGVMAAWHVLSRSLVHTGIRAIWPARGFAAHRSAVGSLDISASGDVMATSDGGEIRLWDPGTGALLRTITAHGGSGPLAGIDKVQLSADGGTVMAWSRSGSARAWSTGSGAQRYSVSDDRLIGTDVIPESLRWILPMAMSPDAARFTADGRRALIGGDGSDQRFRLWDLETCTLLRRLEGHTGMPRAVWIGPGDRIAATGASDGTVRLWDLGTGRCDAVLRGHTHGVMAVTMSADGSLAASAGGYDDRSIRVWDTGTGACAAVLEGQRGNTRRMRFTPDGRFLLSSHDGEELRLWDLATGTCLRTVEAQPGQLGQLALTADGEYAVSGGSDGHVRLWTLDWELAGPRP